MIRPPRPCCHPGCGVLTTTGRCPAHPRQRGPRDYRLYDASPERRETHRFYASPEWQRLRVRILAGQPLCVECQRLGRIMPATQVDHIIPWLDRPELRLEAGNLRPLCAACHTRIGRRTQRGEGASRCSADRP